MIIGFDKGATATKIVGLDGEKILFEQSVAARGESEYELVLRALDNAGIALCCCLRQKS